jgi:hypothetical protein
MPGKRLTVERVDGIVDNVSYKLFSAPSAMWTAAPIQRAMRATVTVADVRVGARVSEAMLLHAGEDGKARRIYRRTLRVDSMSVPVVGPLHVSSASREPAAAISPPQDGTASIRYDGPPATPNDLTLRVRVPFKPRGELRTQLDVAIAIPMLDVLGPRTATWGRLLGPVGFAYSATRVPPPAVKPSEFQQQLKNFQQRWTGPARGWRRYIHIATNSELFALRLAAEPADAEGTPVPLDGTAPRLGRIRVSVPNVVEQARKLVPVFAAANRNPDVRMDDLPYIPLIKPGEPNERVIGEREGQAQYQFGTEIFQLPPTPPESGLNVFGSMSELKLSAGAGVLNVGAQPERRIGAPSPMEFHNLSDGATGRHALIPVELDRDNAQINVRGTADVRINHQPVATQRPLPARVLSRDTILFVATVAAGASLLNGIRLGRRARRRQNPA